MKLQARTGFLVASGATAIIALWGAMEALHTAEYIVNFKESNVVARVQALAATRSGATSIAAVLVSLCLLIVHLRRGFQASPSRDSLPRSRTARPGQASIEINDSIELEETTTTSPSGNSTVRRYRRRRTTRKS
jgi:hypothetical protein